MKNYIYTEKNSTTKIFIGNLLIFPSLLAILFFSKENGLIFLLIYLIAIYWGVFFISSEGLEIDFQNRRFRKLFCVYGIRIGLTWTFFSEIKYVALVETTVKQTFGGRGFKSSATATITEKTVKINIFDNNEKYFTLYFANNKYEALKIASQIEEVYKIEVVKNF